MSDSKLPTFITRRQLALPGVEDRAKAYREQTKTARIQDVKQQVEDGAVIISPPSKEHANVITAIKRQIAEFPKSAMKEKFDMHFCALLIFTRRDIERARAISATVEQARSLVEKNQPAEALVLLQQHFRPAEPKP